MSDEPKPLGIFEETGHRLPPIDEETLAAFADAEEADLDPDIADAKSKSHLGTDDSVDDPRNLRETGWAIMFSPGVTPEMKKALAPLIAHRHKQAGGDKALCPDPFEGPTGYREGDTAQDWLKRRGNIPMGDVNPRAGVPYYVLIVGPPTEIPFEFQFELDLYWAVGRLWFDTAKEFEDYVQAVLDYETSATVAASRRISYFAPTNGEDEAMKLFQELVTGPIQQSSAVDKRFGEGQNFLLQLTEGEAATKEALDRLYRGKLPGGQPALIFSGSHGMTLFPGNNNQDISQGAIVCADWPGEDPPLQRMYFAGRDLPADARVHGTIQFLFACYGGGWPRNDTFSRTKKRSPLVADAPAVARLPQALLAKGALAVVTHVDRAWTSSYRSLANFRSLITRLASGQRAGHATDKLNQKWAAASIQLAEMLQRKANGLPIDEVDLKHRWVVRDDARNYVVLGDPAVRLRVEDMPALG